MLLRLMEWNCLESESELCSVFAFLEVDKQTSNHNNYNNDDGNHYYNC
jgi:hypothetical protein